MLSLREAKSSGFPLKQQQSLLGEEEGGGFSLALTTNKVLSVFLSPRRHPSLGTISAYEQVMLNTTTIQTCERRDSQIKS